MSAEFCEGLLLSIVERAAAYNNFLRVDMEGSLYTARTIDVVKRVRSKNPAIGRDSGIPLSQRTGRAGTCWHTDAAYGCARERTKSHRKSRSRRSRKLTQITSS